MVDDLKATLEYDMASSLSEPRWTDGYQLFAGVAYEAGLAVVVDVRCARVTRHNFTKQYSEQGMIHTVCGPALCGRGLRGGAGGGGGREVRGPWGVARCGMCQHNYTHIPSSRAACV